MSQGIIRLMDSVALIKLLEALYSQYGYIIIFMASLIETTPIGWAIPGGFMAALGGFYAYGGGISLVAVLVSAWTGMLFTFLIAYYLGAKTGLRLAKKLNQEKNAEMAKTLLKEHGPTILTTSLMANLTRFWVAYIAGSQNYSFFKFLFFSSVAALSWSSLNVAAGYLAGSQRGKLESGLAGLGILSWILLSIAGVVLYIKIKKTFLKP